MNGKTYQFNLDMQGHYIKGCLIAEDETFFVLDNIEVHCGTLHLINPRDGKLYLSKQKIVCYFEVS